MSTERPHHPYSPSSLASLEVCPCYQNRQADTPHERTIAGTRAHGVAESGEDNLDLSDEDAALAVECLEFVAGRKRLMLEAREGVVHDLFLRRYSHLDPDSGDLLAQGEIPEVLEIKEGYLPIDGIDTTAGYFDHALVSWDRKYAELIDFKFGRWEVDPAETNPQGWAYVLGLFRAHLTVDTIKFFFKMPLIGKLSEATFTRDQIPEMYLRLQVIVARAKAARAASECGDFSAANPTAPTCSFCANLARCPKVAALALRIGAKFHPLSIPEGLDSVSLLDARDVSLGLRLAQVVSVWAAAFKTRITNRVLCREADIPPGFMLQSKSNREVADAEKYKTVALAHVTPEQYAASCNVVFGKIEKVIKDAAPRGSKTAAIESFNAELEAVGAVVQGDSFTFLRAVSEKEA